MSPPNDSHAEEAAAAEEEEGAEEAAMEMAVQEALGEQGEIQMQVEPRGADEPPHHLVEQPVPATPAEDPEMRLDRCASREAWERSMREELLPSLQQQRERATCATGRAAGGSSVTEGRESDLDPIEGNSGRPGSSSGRGPRSTPVRHRHEGFVSGRENLDRCVHL